MPNYEYKCVACEHIFELWQNVGDAAPPCPECESEVKKVFHAPRVIFKGSGFYVTDLRAEKESAKSASKPKTAAGESSGESATEKSADKSETKAETTASAPADKSDSTNPSATPSAPANTASSSDKKS